MSTSNGNDVATARPARRSVDHVRIDVPMQMRNGVYQTSRVDGRLSSIDTRTCRAIRDGIEALGQRCATNLDVFRYLLSQAQTSENAPEHPNIRTSEESAG